MDTAKKPTMHELKTDPIVFDAVASGAKTHEIRLNDRDFQVGDHLLLRRTRYSGEDMRTWAPLEYTGEQLTRVVSHIQTGYGLADGWVILSFATLSTPATADAPTLQQISDYLNGLGAIERELAIREAKASAPEPVALTDAQGDVCAGCNGEGTVRAMTSHLGPDDYEYDEQCCACNGTGSSCLKDALVGVGYIQHPQFPGRHYMDRAAVMKIVDARAALAAAQPAQVEEDDEPVPTRGTDAIVSAWNDLPNHLRLAPELVKLFEAVKTCRDVDASVEATAVPEKSGPLTDIAFFPDKKR